MKYVRIAIAVVCLIGQLTQVAYAATDPRRQRRVKRQSIAAPTYINNYAINIPGANGDGVVLADAAGLEPTNGQLSVFMQYKEGSVVGADTLFAKWTEGTPHVASMDIGQTGCAGSPTRCEYRVQLCDASACTAPRIHRTNRGVLTNNEWTSVGVAFDIGASDLEIYIGGAPATVLTSGSFPVAWTDVAANWTVGNRSGPGTRAPIARFKTIMMWRNTRVTGQCMWDLANPNGGGKRRGTGPLPASCPTPTTYCRGGDDDNGAGTTCTDFSGNANHWTLAGTAAFSNTSLPVGFALQTAATNGASRKVIVGKGQSGESGRAPMYTYSPPLFWQTYDASATTYANDLTDATDSGTGDALAMPATEEVGDILYIGWATQFDQLRLNNTAGTQGVGGTCVWEYCSANTGSACTAWSSLSGLVDGSTCFTAARTDQHLSFTLPNPWPAVSVNGSANYYFVRARLTGTYTTNPAYDWAVGDDDQIYTHRARTGIYDNNGPIGTPNGIEAPAEEPVDESGGQAAVFPQTVDGSAAAGPMLATLDALSGLYPSYDWYVVPCPLGSTSAAQWSIAHGLVGTDDGECESRLTTTALGADTEVVAIFVYQGEFECGDAVLAPQWAERWAYNCEETRSALGDRDVPCIFTRLPATVGSCPEIATVRAEQAAICNYLDHCVVIDAPEGPFIADGIHLDHGGVRSLGTLRGAAFRETSLGQAITP